MGLDQYAYVAGRKRQYDDYYEVAEWNEDTKEFETDKVQKPIELAYWRKHPNLQGWMERLYDEKVKDGDAEPYASFNGIEVELTWDDVDRLEQAILNGDLPKTTGFFFGDDSTDYYRSHDLEFCRRAKAELFLGLKVFYNSSW